MQAITTTAFVGARFFCLSLWHFLSMLLAGLIMANISPLPEVGEPVAMLSLVSVSLVETLVVMWLIVHLRLRGLGLIGIIFIVFHGTRSFMMLMEAALFLNLWVSPPLLTLSDVWAMEMYGLLMAMLYCPVAVWVMGKLSRDGKQSLPTMSGMIANLPAKLAVVAVVYALCYLLAGAFILVPLAGEAFDVTYGNLQTPVLIPLVQVGRGSLWAFLIVPMVIYFSGSNWHMCVGVGVLLAVLGTAQLLIPNPYMLAALRYAHAVEVGISMFIFGALAAWILRQEKNEVETAVLPL